MMRKSYTEFIRGWPIILLLCFTLTLAGCSNSGGNWFADDVEGYEELQDTLSPEEAARLGVFDAVAAYTPVQIVFEQLVLNPALPSAMKESIKATDLEVTTAIRMYNALVNSDAGQDETTLHLTVLIQALQRAQLLLIEAQAAGLGG